MFICEVDPLTPSTTSSFFLSPVVSQFPSLYVTAWLWNTNLRTIKPTNLNQKPNSSLSPWQLQSLCAPYYSFLCFCLPTNKANYLTMRPCCMVSLLALFFLVSLVEGRFVVEKNSITVLSPHKLRGKRDGAIGNFGLPDYGGYLVGSLVYPEKGSHGCDVFEGDKPFKFRSYRPTIVLLDRGGISFFSF